MKFFAQGRTALGLAVLLSTGLCAGQVATAAEKPYEGVALNAVIRTGPVLAKRTAERAAEFEAKTGAKITVVEVPTEEMFQKVMTDWSSGTNSIDIGFLISPWIAEFAGGGFLTDVSDRVAADKALNASDIAPYFREFSQNFNGKTYGLVIDGDFHMVYYRTDVLKDLNMAPPKTWGDYLKVAEAANGKDLNGDGESDYGSCMFKKRNSISYWGLLSVAAGFLQSQGTAQGMFFDKETMKPLVNNPAFIKALEIYKESGKFAPPDELNQDIGASRGLFLSGRCALTLDWGDIGPLSIDETQSKVKGKVGSMTLPGSTEVLNRETGKLEVCNATLCPYAEDGVNRTPYSAFGGWLGTINANLKDEKKVEAAYQFLSYMNQAEQSNLDVTIGWTGMNPYRISQTNSIKPWVDAGFDADSATNYLAALNNSLNSPNMASDLRIPGSAQYLGTVLDTELARYLANEITAQQAAANIEAGWEEITEDQGRDKQRELYVGGLAISNK